MSADRAPRIAHSRIPPGAVLDGLILDGQYRQALAAMRSLGRGGSTLGSVVCASDEKWALSFRSRWCSLAAIVADFAEPGSDYVDAVLDLVDQYRVRFILPCHDGSIEALRKKRVELERRTTLALASESALNIAVDKMRTLALATELGIAVPRSIPVTDAADVRAALNDTGYPAVVKPVRSWVQSGTTGTGMRLSCEAVRSLDEAQRIVDLIQRAGGDVVVQEWLPGRRDAVTLFYARDTVWAAFAQTSHREVPPLGGVSILCESMPLLRDVRDPAEQLVRAMTLEGCSMIEFRRDRDGHPKLMEVNPRLSGSTALAVSAGVDFPSLVQTWALGRELTAVSGYRVGVRRRWLSGDLEYLTQVFKQERGIDFPSRLSALSVVLSDFVRRPSALDVFSASDMGPAWLELRTIPRRLRHSLRVLMTRLTRSTNAPRP